MDVSAILRSKGCFFVKSILEFYSKRTKMCVEISFGLLKGHKRILLKRIEVKLQQVLDIVGACII